MQEKLNPNSIYQNILRVNFFRVRKVIALTIL